jgi:hypothetical protein
MTTPWPTFLLAALCITTLVAGVSALLLRVSS